MRNLLLSAAALFLLAAPALAEPHGNRGEEHSNRVGKASVAPQVQDRAQAESRGERRGEIRGNAPAEVANRGGRDSGDRGNFRDRGDRGFNGRSENRGDQNRDGRERFSSMEGRDRLVAPAQRFERNRADFNRDGRTDYRSDYRRGAGYGGPRHDFSGFRDYHRNFNASHRFNVPYYRRPAGWYEHRWRFGEFLPAAFWARDYWILDFEEYDLPPPPYGAVWVRVGGDALLIDEESGEIITVAYDIFY